MKCLILILLLLPVYFSSAQNVGIGTNNPTQRLDVNGNVNVSGNILANGVSGGSGQVLMTNSQGVMTWGNVALGNSSGYDSVAVFQVGPSDCVGFSCPANNTFIITIPGNIDKIRIQAWGPGGIGVGTAANFSASGGGGGYVEAIVGGVGNKIMGIIVG
ncbi:MAG TPA: hypothetical protein VHM26_02705, partial [Chitinophagaceae bacterium]|nr:hypothetical protein [Chitinophagaceae bacterium]